MNQAFTTPCVPTPATEPFRFSDPLLLMGSCFAQAMGDQLREDQFRVLINPFGIVYNPVTMAVQLELLMGSDSSRLPEPYFDGELHHSLLHHGSFSSPDRVEMLKRIDEHFRRGQEALRQARMLILTWGHTDVFYEKDSNLPVANCHKRPSDHFHQEVATLDQLLPIWRACIQKLKKFNANLIILLTVSPVRYLRRGFTANTRSKATLHLLAQHLEQDGVHYFPAFEILTDELRDYRFYAGDLIHPSELAEATIYERFLESWHVPDERDLVKQIRSLHNLLHHRSLHPGSPSDVRFKEKRIEALKAFRKAHPDYPWMFADVD